MSVANGGWPAANFPTTRTIPRWYRRASIWLAKSHTISSIRDGWVFALSTGMVAMIPASAPRRAFGTRRTITARLLVAAVLLVSATASAQPPPPDPCGAPSVIVREDHGVYSVAAQFLVPQPPAAALAVLTDYERIPQFMPGVESSVVIERTPGHAIVEQQAVSHLMMFTKRVQLRLDILEGTDSLRFRDRSGRSFSRYEGEWRVSATDDGSRISYALTAQPAFDVPEFLLKKLLKRDSGQMIDGLRRELAARETGRR
jgi:ribosome-associated toxin RatA of RatAB toxin-antitoxin module